MIREEEKNFLNNTNKREEKKINGKHSTLEKQLAFKNFMEFLKILILILATPFLLIIFFVIAICKNIK